MRLYNRIKKRRKALAAAGLGMALAAIAGVAGLEALHASATPEFCMICHEMRVVGEQGWMRSSHYHNDRGVVAGCGDCHIPPETDLAHMLWVKARDGNRDIFVHLFGEHDPARMDWDELTRSARAKISDSSCMKCHQNLTAQGLPLKAIMAHREKMRLAGVGLRRCVDCHTEESHGAFKQYLAGPGPASDGGNQ